MKTQDRYMCIRGTPIAIHDNGSVTFPQSTTENEIEVISWYLFKEGFLELPDECSERGDNKD